MHSTVTWEEPWGLYVRASGTLTPPEFFDRTVSITGDARFSDLRYVVLNYQDLDGHTFDLDDPAGIARSNAILLGAVATNPRLVCAVVGRPPILEMARTLTEVAGLPWRLGYFESEIRALDWLATQTLVFQPRPPPAGG
ncbi:MAG: hypothetical protein U1F08_11375 [Steroidobacteraceae bacterium]